MADIKRVTLHPLKDDGTLDLNTNLYPKTLIDGIVDREGVEVEVALTSDIPTNYVTTDTNQTIAGEKAFNKPITINYDDQGIILKCHSSDGVINFLKIDTGESQGEAFNLYAIKNIIPYGDLVIDAGQGCGLVTPLLKTTDGGVYSLRLPDTDSFDADKTIATTDQCGTKLYRHQTEVKIQYYGEEDYGYFFLDYISTDATKLSVQNFYTKFKPISNFIYGYSNIERLAAVNYDDTGFFVRIGDGVFRTSVNSSSEYWNLNAYGADINGIVSVLDTVKAL